jgi:hypothetical protein
MSEHVNERPVAQGESIRLITGRRRFDSFRADLRCGNGDVSGNGTKALVAEPLALNQAGEGSSPSGPNQSVALVVQRRGLRTRNAATWVRVPPGALCCFIDNSDAVMCPCCSGSLLPCHGGSAGSTPAGHSSAVNGKPRYRCGLTVRRRPVKATIGGSTPPAGARIDRSRFKRQQIPETEGQADWRRHPIRNRASDEPWGFNSLSFRLVHPSSFILHPFQLPPSSFPNCGIGPAARLLASNQATGVRIPDPALGEISSVPGRAVRHGLPRSDRRVQLPRGALGNRLTGRLPDFESGGGGSSPPSRTFWPRCGQKVSEEFGERSEERIGLLTTFSSLLSRETRLGRQPADHSRSEREMLRVRIPPEPLWERMKNEG